MPLFWRHQDGEYLRLATVAIREEENLRSALELHGVANQVFQTVYYFSAGARKDVVFDHVTYHRVAFPRALASKSHLLFQTELVADKIPAAGRERSFVDCLLFRDSGRLGAGARHDQASSPSIL